MYFAEYCSDGSRTTRKSGYELQLSINMFVRQKGALAKKKENTLE